MQPDIKSILVGLTAGSVPAPSTAFDFGLSLARLAGAHLTVQAGSLKLALTDTFVTETAVELVQAENRRLKGVTDRLVAAALAEADGACLSCAAESVQLSFTDLAARLVAEARVHDLCIVDADPAATGIGRGLIEAVLFQSGRPVLVVPRGVDRFTLGRIVVAWDGSAAAARAVADALPLLKAAEIVDVVSVVGEKDLSKAIAGAALAPHLARHGIRVTTADLVAEDRDVAASLTGYVSRSDATLLVMGGFQHSRLREWILGGVTASLLGNCPVPLLLAH